MTEQCDTLDGQGARCSKPAGHAGWHSAAAAPAPGWAPSTVSDGRLDARGLIAAIVAVSVLLGLAYSQIVGR